MNTERLDRLITTLYEANEKKVYVPIVVWGEAGVGKSQAVARAASRLGINFVDLRLGSQEVGDLMGLPQIENGRTHYAAPAWWPEQGTKGILFLDEMNRSHRDIRGAIFQLILDRRMMTHQLPDGWLIIAACNPATENYEVDDSYDKAFMARFCHVTLQPDTKEWLEWAKNTGAPRSILQTIEMHPKLLGNDYCNLPKVHPTPRTWAMFASLLNCGLDEDLQMEVGLGLLGEEAPATWRNVMESQERHIPGLDLLKKWRKGEKTKETVKRQTEEGRMDLLKQTFDEIVEIAKTENWKPNYTEVLIEVLMQGVPADFGFQYIKEEFALNEAVLKGFEKSDPFVDWLESVAKVAKEQ